MNKNKKLVIYGIGETADIAYEYFTHDSDYEVVAFTVDAAYKKEDTHYGLPVIPFEEIESHFPPSAADMFAASTYNQLNRVRKKLYDGAKSKGYACATYVSTHAFVWHNVKLGENVFIFENNVLQHGVEVGNNVILWSGNHIGHQTKIRDNVYISSHCVISGFCDIGEYSFLGVNSTFNDNIAVGRDCIVGSGALIVKNTPEGSVMIGSPAKPAAKSSYETFKVDPALV